MYDADHNRIKESYVNGQIYFVNPGNQPLFEKQVNFNQTGVTHYRHFIGGVAIFTQYSTTGSDTKYSLKDHLGSTTVVTSGSGAVLERYSYDPWGRARQITGADMTPPYARVPTGRRGFTGHETLAENGGMIHMNGRLFDPDIGRFMTADPTVQFAGYSQSYNRYSYLFNNPLGGTDPTGFEQLTDEQYVTIVVAVVVTIATYGSTSAYLAGLGYSATVVEIGASAAAGAAGAFASTLVATEGNLEASFKSAAIGGITGAAFAGIGQAAPFASNPVGNVAARAVVGCAQSSAQGGRSLLVPAALPTAVGG